VATRALRLRGIGECFPKDGQDYDAVYARAEEGDKAALRVVREHLTPDVWQQIGDLAGHGRQIWIELVTSGNRVLEEGTRRRLAALGAELAGPEPTPLERLLVERVLATWLQVQHAEWTYANLFADGGRPFEQHTHAQKRLDRAHFRHLAAVRSLAVVRRLLGPAIQVGQLNVAHQQTNVVRDT
jgi:hypothetical protein